MFSCISMCKRKKPNSAAFKNVNFKRFYICEREDLALNNLKGLICHKNQTKSN